MSDNGRSARKIGIEPLQGRCLITDQATSARRQKTCAAPLIFGIQRRWISTGAQGRQGTSGVLSNAQVAGRRNQRQAAIVHGEVQDVDIFGQWIAGSNISIDHGAMTGGIEQGPLESHHRGIVPDAFIKLAKQRVHGGMDLRMRVVLGEHPADHVHPPCGVLNACE